MIARAAVAAMLLLAVACGGREERAAPPESAAASPPPPVASASSDCPRTGVWDDCSVRERLERAGLAPQPRDSVRHSFLSVPGAVFGVGRGELQLFLYPDAAARTRDLAALDSASVQPRDAAVDWVATPTLITSGNLAAILLSDNPTQVERVRLALTAGVPRADR